MSSSRSWFRWPWPKRHRLTIRLLPWVVLAAALAGLGWVALLALRGRAPARTDRLAFGTLLALAAWPLWLLQASG